MKRYLTAIAGGLLALLAAFGWTVAIAFFVTWKFDDIIFGIHVRNGMLALVIPLIIFTVGFFFAFRAAYVRKNSN